MQFSGIIFDFNGVLWWDSDLQEAAWMQFAAALRGRPLSATEVREQIHGRPNQHALQYLTGRTIHGAELEELTQQKERLYRRMCLAQGKGFRLSPGAIPLLDDLAVRGVPRTIATASERTNLDFFIEHLDLTRWFDPALIVYDDGRLPGKPAPDVYLEAAQRLGLAPVACVVVEDSVSGLAAAQAAGIGQVVALGPPAAQPTLRKLPGVDSVIGSLAELADARII